MFLDLTLSDINSIALSPLGMSNIFSELIWSTIQLETTTSSIITAS